MKHWYVLAYDIRDPRRLQRTHRRLKREGMALQKSVFGLRVTGRALQALKADINDLVDDQIDDVRLYPVSRPGDIWSLGEQSRQLSAVWSAGADNRQAKKNTASKKRSGVLGWITDKLSRE